MRARLRWIIGAALLVLAAPAVHPPLLAFPYSTTVGPDRIWSEEPIDQALLSAILAARAGTVAASPLQQSIKPQQIFLTKGGWRWLWLARQSAGAFAFTSPATEAIVVNRHSLEGNAVWNGATIGGRRSLSGTLAHETCHILLHERFGLSVDWTAPAWLREGFCDHVAQESSLGAQDAAWLKARGVAHPALPYFEGRRRVEQILMRNGQNVDALFASPDQPAITH